MNHDSMTARTTRAALCATLALTIGSAAFAQTNAQTDGAQRAVLSGSTGELAWTLYGPGQLSGLSDTARGTLRLSAPTDARVVGAKYEGATAVLAMRTSASTRRVYDQLDRDLTAQGFRRVSQNLGSGEASATYNREGRQVSLRVARQNDVVRAELNLSAFATSGAASAGGNASNTASNSQNAARGDLLSVVASRDNLSMFRQALDRANLSNWLRGGSSLTPDLTVFAPTNTAFMALPAEQREALMNDSSVLYAVINNHLVRESVDTARLRSRSSLTSLQDVTYNVTTSSGGLRVGNASVVTPDLRATNGVVHVVDRVLVPSNVNFAALANESAATTGADSGSLLNYERNGVRYDFYPLGASPVPAPGGARVSVLTPDGATNVERPARDGDVVTVRFNAARTLREVFESYDRHFRQQGYAQVAGRLSEDQSRISAVYERNGVGSGVALVVESGDAAAGLVRYTTTFDFTP